MSCEDGKLMHEDYVLIIISGVVLLIILGVLWLSHFDESRVCVQRVADNGHVEYLWIRTIDMERMDPVARQGLTVTGYGWCDQ